MMREDDGSIKQPVFEFHIERQVRRKYDIDDALFSQQGSIIFSDFHAVRQFVYKLNRKRDPRLHVYPGEVNAAGLIEEIYHYILGTYEKQVNPQVFDKARKYLKKTIGEEQLYKVLYDFLHKFPSTAVYKGELSVAKYLKGTTSGRSNQNLVIQEAMMLFFNNFNPANKKLKELFDEKYLEDPLLFRQFIDHLEDFFEEQPPYGPKNQDIFDLFKTPILSSPDDISKQIDFITEKWESLLSEKIRLTLLKSKDLLKEDVRFDTMGGDPLTAAPVYKGMADDASRFSLGKSGYKYAEDSEADYEEPEQFTDDVHWMPSVVMIAKNSYVWLDQLSKKYQREIRRLDQIPDEELDQLRRWNFTGLWLIGLWERSEASKRIKHIMGNVDAVSSAYSLYDYEIARDLGGDEAYNNLNERAKARGLRLASDMVPNHTGVYSKWVIEHPDFFIQAPVPPFPGYQFTGENLSQHPDIEIRIEDGYYHKTDASVVFQWVNKQTNQVRYIYHGNDGTMMPWNDTAQLDMLKQEVREAVIQKIFHVARRFSIIRFDAAMTLAKKHFARLWYPRPGSGGDIPSRADYAMTKQQFDDFFPREFWREVVDRINDEMPETLLLAEAFWFMEGYFVRTLGMHRVYNSAFMHMLKNEENEKYRDLITNTLEFEPEILKRYVNFMSNPDEETAIRQFGTHDKYFGVCMLMNTLPGLPMYGHGQIEGYTEKYGMEYQRAYYNEDPHQWLIEKHEREIFPLAQKRYLFCEVEHFNIFDFIDGFGNVNENVFAYTNRFRNEKALVLFNNKYEQAQGRIQFSASKLTKNATGKESLSVSLGQALKINGNDNVFYIFREHISGLEYLKKGSDLYHNGWTWHLNGFEYRVFWDFREVYDDTGMYEKLLWKTGGRGVAHMGEAMEEIRMQPMHDAFASLFAEDILDFLLKTIHNQERSQSEKLGYTLLKSRFHDLIENIRVTGGLDIEDPDQLAEHFIKRLKSLECTFDYILGQVNEKVNDMLVREGYSSLDELLVIGGKSTYRENIIVLMACYVLEVLEDNQGRETQQPLMQKLKFYLPLQGVLQKTGRGDAAITRDIRLVMILQKYGKLLFDFSGFVNRPADKVQGPIRKRLMAEKAGLALQMLDDKQLRTFIGVNEHEGVVYFSKESYEELLEWFFSMAVLDYFCYELDDRLKIKESQKNLLLAESIQYFINARDYSIKAGYQLEKLKKQLKT